MNLKGMRRRVFTTRVRSQLLKLSDMAFVILTVGLFGPLRIVDCVFLSPQRERWLIGMGRGTWWAVW